MTPARFEELKLEFEYEDLSAVNRRTWTKIKKLLRGHARTRGCKRAHCSSLADNVVLSVKSRRRTWNRATHGNLLEFLFGVVRTEARHWQGTAPANRKPVVMSTQRIRTLVAKMNANEVIKNLPTIEILLSRLNDIMKTAGDVQGSRETPSPTAAVECVGVS